MACPGLCMYSQSQMARISYADTKKRPVLCIRKCAIFLVCRAEACLTRHVHPCRFPVWIWVHDNLIFYGLPIHGIMGVKIAIDCGGAAVTADQRSFTPDKLNTEKTDEFVKKFFPKVSRGNIFLHVRAHVHSN